MRVIINNRVIQAEQNFIKGTFIFIFTKTRMERDEYEKFVNYIRMGEKPTSLIGKENKDKWKLFKKKTIGMYLRGGNDEILIITKGRGLKERIVVADDKLNEIWKHFHESSEYGGHMSM
jgi:hypothetical protein